eukprot:13691829-Alexandrium_andersonii.AAC.1
MREVPEQSSTSIDGIQQIPFSADQLDDHSLHHELARPDAISEGEQPRTLETTEQIEEDSVAADVNLPVRLLAEIRS